MRSRVEENPAIEYNDGAHKIFLSSLPGLKGEMSDALEQFLAYVNGESAEGDFVQRLEEAVARAKTMETCERDKKMLAAMGARLP